MQSTMTWSKLLLCNILRMFSRVPCIAAGSNEVPLVSYLFSFFNLCFTQCQFNSRGSFPGFLHPRGCTCINLDPFLSLRDNSCSILKICIGTNLIWINILNLELLSNHIVLNLFDCIRWLWSIFVHVPGLGNVPCVLVTITGFPLLSCN